MSLWGNPIVAPGAQQNYSNQFYNTDIAPGIASQQTAEQQSGMLNSSAGGAELGQMQAQGRAQQTLQGQQYYTNALNNLLNERTNYYGTAIQSAFEQAQGVQGTEQLALQQAQNQAGDALTAAGINSAQNLALAGYSFQAPQLQNAFNLQSNQNQNNFAQQNYQTGASIYGNQLSADQAAARTNAGLLGKGGSGSLSGSLTGLNALATP